ncbi:MAG: hypothetical protein QMC96_09040 [Methanomicrobiales archaeon]|nr:hypothetical protein [Methanomicrobiales archaeon]
MPMTEPYGITQEISRKIKIAVEGRCEVCQETCSLPDLRIHPIPGGDHPDLQRNILILCRLCHTHVHALPVPPEQQRAWVDRRPIVTRKAIRRIMGYRLKPYIPPDSGDPAELFAEAARSWGLNGSG